MILILTLAALASLWYGGYRGDLFLWIVGSAIVEWSIFKTCLQTADDFKSNINTSTRDVFRFWSAVSFWTKIAYIIFILYCLVYGFTFKSVNPHKQYARKVTDCNIKQYSTALVQSTSSLPQSKYSYSYLPSAPTVTSTPFPTATPYPSSTPYPTPTPFHISAEQEGILETLLQKANVTEIQINELSSKIIEINSALSRFAYIEDDGRVYVNSVPYKNLKDKKAIETIDTYVIPRDNMQKKIIFLRERYKKEIADYNKQKEMFLLQTK
jgi:hypothetical protein